MQATNLNYGKIQNAETSLENVSQLNNEIPEKKHRVTGTAWS